MNTQGRNDVCLPEHRKVYGILCGEKWLQKLDGDVFFSPYRPVMAALRMNMFDPQKYEVREIGPDGLPVPEPVVTP